MNYRQVIEKIESSGPPIPPERAYELFGLDEQEYHDLQQVANPEISYRGLRALGANRRHRSRPDSLGSATCTVPNYFQTRGDVYDNIVHILRQATPAGRSTILILTDSPDSALFDALEPYHLLLFMSPTSLTVDQAPGPDWEEVPGGWRKGRKIQARRSSLLQRGTGGQLRYSAAQAARRVEEIRELCHGWWPTVGTQGRSEIETAEQRLAEIGQMAEILREIQTYERNTYPDLGEWDNRRQRLRRSIEINENRIRALEEEVASIRNRIAETDRRIAEQEPQITLDRQAKYQQVIADLEAVEQLNELDFVTEAELLDPFLAGSRLRVTTNIKPSGGRRPLSLTLDRDGLQFDRAIDFDLESRALAIAEKFSRGQFAEALRIICQPLLASGQFESG